MQAEYFPVQLDRMGANFEFLQIADATEHFTGINNVETEAGAGIEPAKGTIMAAALAWEVPSECAGRNLDPYLLHVRARLRGRVFLNQ